MWIGSTDYWQYQGPATESCTLVSWGGLILRKTHVVLNSLSGDYISRSIDLLVEEGRFVEHLERRWSSCQEIRCLLLNSCSGFFSWQSISFPEESDIGTVAKGSYLITVSLGGLGLLTAKILVCLGVRQLVLLSWSGRVSHEGQGLEKDLSCLRDESGADVRAMRCDVSDEALVIDMLDKVRYMDGLIVD